MTQTVNRSATTTTLTSTINPALVNQIPFFHADVTSATGTPTGSVQFTFTPLSGISAATFSTTVSLSLSGITGATVFGPPSGYNSAGTYTVTAAYLGDAASAPSSDGLTQTVRSPIATTTTLTSATNPSLVGDLLQFTAHVSAASGTQIPSGTVQFIVGNPNQSQPAPVTLDANGDARLSFVQGNAATIVIEATYSGNLTFATSTASLTQVVLSPATVTAVGAAPATSVFGQSVTLTATVTGSATPIGTVTFYDGTTALGTATLLNGHATLSLTSLAVGDHSIAAAYGGSLPQFAASTSAALPYTVSRAITSAVVVSGTEPSVFGQPVTWTATVNAMAPGAGTPSGTVTFSDGATVLGSNPLVAGQTTFSSATLSVGTHTITASYGGGPSFNSTTSPAITQTVGKASTATLVGSSGPTVFGQAVTFNATVSAVAPGAGVPPGMVTFFDGTTSLGSAALAGGSASITTGTLAVGSHVITATFGGSVNFSSSTSTAITQPVNKADTATTVTSSGPATLGDTVTFTASVGTLAPGAGSPGGLVTFSDGTSVLGTAALNHGTATLSTAALGIGTHTVTASYAGDASFNGSLSTAAVTQTVSYRICVLYDGTKANQTGSTLPIKIQLCDASGQNRSLVDRVLTATGIAIVSGGPAGPLSAAGNANPGNVFRFDAGTYLFNLKLSGFGGGVYHLRFTVSGDPIEHAVQFTVR